MTNNARNEPRLIHPAPLTRLFLTSHAARIASFPILISIPNQIPVSISPSAIARVSVAVSSWFGSLCYTAGASSSQMPRRSFATAEEGLCFCGLVKATEKITALRECRFIQAEATTSPRPVSFIALLSPCYHHIDSNQPQRHLRSSPSLFAFCTLEQGRQNEQVYFGFAAAY
jgi:hypothetical protein